MFAEHLPCVGMGLGERIPATANIPLSVVVWNVALHQVPFKSLGAVKVAEVEGQSRSPMVRISMGSWEVQTQIGLCWLLMS